MCIRLHFGPMKAFFAKPTDFSTLVTDPAAKSFFKDKMSSLPFKLIL